MEIIDNFIENSCNNYEQSQITTEKSLKTSYMVEVKTGGNEGGSCYGTSSHSFTVDEEDQMNELFNGLEYLGIFMKNFGVSSEAFEEWKEKKYQEKRYSEDFSYETYGDYYGNNSKYAVYVFKLSDVMKDLSVDSEFIEYVEKKDAFFETEKKEQMRLDKIKELEEKLKNFDQEQSKNYQSLQQQKNGVEKRLAMINQEISDFEKNKLSKRKSLEEELSKLQDRETISSRKNKP